MIMLGTNLLERQSVTDGCIIPALCQFVPYVCRVVPLGSDNSIGYDPGHPVRLHTSQVCEFCLGRTAVDHHAHREGPP